ncbi:MAG: hypothetical protein KY428_10235 [Bacteroidetes bacterium]|nr:hypothetical protein [Bacteroidota bacterium]
MRKLHRLIFAVVLCATALFYSGCEQNADPDLNRVGWAYFPLALGQYHLYDVYRINYNFSSENDTLRYELKEIVADYYLNQESDTVFVLHRLQREANNSAWELDSAYLLQRTPSRLIQTANNRPQLPLIFPLAEGLTWNANMLNASPADSFKITAVGSTIEVSGQTYENCVRVEEEDFENTILGIDQREAVYAYGIGLVYKFVNKLNYCTDPECYNQQQISTGLYLEMSLKESGTEIL